MWSLLENFNSNQQLIAFRTGCLNKEVVRIAHDEYEKALARKLPSTQLYQTEKADIIETIIKNKEMFERELHFLEVPIHRHYLIIILLHKYFNPK